MKDIITVLEKGNFVSLRKIKNDSKGIFGYEYLHEDRCSGKIVAILPYRYNDEGIEFLLRNEITPCWNPDKKIISSITGGVDKGNTAKETCKIELLEEAGYDIDMQDLCFLGKIYGTKSCDTQYYLYTIDLTYYDRQEATGDGSELEKQAHCFWGKFINDSLDPFIYVLYHRLQGVL